MNVNRVLQDQIGSKLVQLIKAQECLYNEKSKHGAFANERGAQWDKIMMEMNRTFNMDKRE